MRDMRRSILSFGTSLLAGSLLTLCVACPAHTRMPARQQMLTRRGLEGQSRQLASSLYVTPFFRDARYRLLTELPPEHVDLMRDPKGRRITPGRAIRILPAGTRVRIRRIEFPTSSAVTARSLFTPRYFTWVYLEVPQDDRLHILVMRDDPTTRAAFERALGRWLTREDRAKALAELPEEVRRAVETKQIVAGMPREAVLWSWGWPLTIQTQPEGRIGVERFLYEDGRWVEVEDGHVRAWNEAEAPPEGGEARDRTSTSE
ncbi:MAG: hypothetical protein D6729_18500 [Deltaproteobacteria bacterium]|nr:MAG: hypothetical protein D6729_18500 [Deltaproteobacteria bacterium]